MFVRSTVLAAAAMAASLATLAAPAAAQNAEGILVHYGDLDLTGATGRQALDRRIAGAAAELCGSFRAVELNWANEVRACRAETIALTQPQRNAAVGRSGSVEVANAATSLRVSRAAN